MLILKPFQKERARAGGGKRGGWLPDKFLGAKGKVGKNGMEDCIEIR